MTAESLAIKLAAVQLSWCFYSISLTALNDDVKLQKADLIPLLSTPHSVSELEVDGLEELSYLCYVGLE